MIRAARTTQPYRKGPRNPSGALTAMLLGASPTLGNPQDAGRRAAVMGHQGPVGHVPGGLAELLRRIPGGRRSGAPPRF